MDDGQAMHEYHVEWAIDLDATRARQAAEEARESMDKWDALCFEVREWTPQGLGEPVLIDLSEEDPEDN